jgi:hypothetical protein
MGCVRIQSGATEPIQLYVVGANGNPLTGLADLYVRVRRGDGLFLDWNDMTFKSVGWATLNQALSEASAANAPGLYEVTGGLNTGAIIAPNPNDYYTVIPLQTPGSNARLPAPGQIAVGKWADRLDANVSTRATQAQILSDAIPFAGADIAAILADTAAVDGRLPVDPADESNQLAQHAITQAAIAALNNPTPGDIADAVWDEPTATHTDPGSTGEAIRHLDVDVSTRAVPGDAMDLVAQAVDANALDVTAVAEIADGVWDEALAGHTSAGSAGQAQNRLDATISSRAAPGAQMDLVNDALDSASLAASAVAEMADGVWDELLAGHAAAGSAGEAQARVDVAVSTRSAPGAQMALTPSAVAGVADGVWDEPLAGHLTVGSTGKALQDAGAVSDPNVIAAAVWDKSAAAHTTPGTMGQLENRLDANISTRAAPGDPMALQANSVNATSIATAGANKIRDTILSDATPFQGARIDAAISSRAAPGAAMDLVAGAVDSAALDPTAVGAVADGVWDEPIAGHLTAGSTGKVLSDGSNPAAIADAVWDEALAGHAGVGTTGEAQGRLDAAVSTRAAPGAAMDLVTDAVDAAALSTTAVQEIRNSILSDGIPFQGARIDAAISSRAAPGAQMDLVDNAVDSGAVATTGANKIGGAAWDAVAAAHATPGTTGALLDHLDADVTSRAAPGAQMALTPAAVAAVADGVWDESLTGHTSTGSTGKALEDASQAVDPAEVATAVWDEPRASHVIPGTMGEAQEQSSTVATQVAKIDQAATVAPGAAATGSLLDRLANKNGAKTYDQSTDSLEGIRDRIG